MQRRSFVQKTFAFLLALPGIAFLIQACGDDDDSTTTTTSGSCSSGATPSIGSNHGHTMASIAQADIDAGTAQSYSITSGGHTHTLNVTSQNFTDLKNNGSVNVTSTTDSSHAHLVTLTC